MKRYRITMQSGYDKAPCIIQIDTWCKWWALVRARMGYYYKHKPVDIHVEEVK